MLSWLTTSMIGSTTTLIGSIITDGPHGPSTQGPHLICGPQTKLGAHISVIGFIGSQTGFVGSQTINGPHILIISGRHFAPIIGWQGLTTIFGPHISTLSLTGAQKSTLKSSFD